MKLKWVYLFLLFLIPLLFYHYDLVLTTSIAAVTIWLKKVFPFLFIMFVLNDLLINLNFASLFTSCTPFIWGMSLLSGAPSNAFIIAQLYQLKKINKASAHSYLLFTYFANPLFLFNMLNFLFSRAIALKLILIHYLSNTIIYLFIRRRIPKMPLVPDNKAHFDLGSSIKKSMNTLIMILGTITLFMVLTSIICKTLHLSFLMQTILQGLAEVTQGLNALSKLNVLPKIKEILAISFISFGGISIHTQVKCLLDEAHLEYRYFLKGRIFQSAIAIFLTALT